MDDDGVWDQVQQDMLRCSIVYGISPPQDNVTRHMLKKGETMIQEGLLWFDDDPKRPVAEKVKRAVARYEQKYGHGPNICYVHPDCFSQQLRMDVAAVEIVPAKSVLPHHFWLGVQVADKQRK